MPAILGPGSVSLETCASEAQARMYRIYISRGGVSFGAKEETGFRKKRLIRAQQVLTNLKVAGYTPFETEGVIERAAPGVRQPCRHGDHHSARQTGCVQPTLTPPTDRRRTVAMLGLRRLRTWR